MMPGLNKITDSDFERREKEDIFDELRLRLDKIKLSFSKKQIDYRFI